MDLIVNMEQMQCMAQKGRYAVGFILLDPEGKKVFKVKSISPVQSWKDSELLYLEEVPSTPG